MSLHRYLTRMIWLCVLPLLLLATYLAITYVHSMQDTHDRDAVNVASNLASEIDQTLSARISALHMLAVSPLADHASDWKALYQEALGFHQGFGSHVILTDPQRRTLFNTRRPFGFPSPVPPQVTGRSASKTVLATGKPAVGDVYFGPVANETVVGIGVPGLRDGKIAFVVGTTIETRYFQNRLDKMVLPAGWRLALLDNTGEAIARRGPPGRQTSRASDFAKRVVIKSELSQWSVVLEIPRHIYFSPLLAAAMVLAIAVLGTTLIGVLGGTWASRRLGKTLASLANTPALGAPAPHITEIATVRRPLDASFDAHTEAARRASEQRFRATFEQAAVGIALVAPDGHLLLANQTFCNITGYPQDELLKKTFQDITHPDDLEADLAFGQKLLAGDIETFSMEKRYLRKGGATVWINLTIALVRRADGSPDYFISVVEDIQRRKAAEAALQASEINLWVAQRMAGIGMWRWDLRTNRRTWSEEIYVIFGIDPHLPPVVFPEIQAYYTPESCTQLAAAMKAVVERGTPYDCDAEVVRADGTHRWISSRGEATRDADGAVVAVHGMLQDITERKLAEDELDQHRHHLELLVVSRTIELRQALDAAEAANHAKRIFLATMSHELRTPLNAVVGLAGLLADSPLGRRQRDYTNKIQLSAKALRAVIDDILDFSKIEAGALKLEQAPFSLAAILHTTATVIGTGLRYKSIEALFDVPPDVPDALIGDATRLQQILLNLSSNAVKFTKAGAIVISVRCLARDAAQVTLQFAVRDTGIGISSEQLGPIFDSFVQAESSTTRLHGGSGLGLTISAELIRLMGSQIEVDSTPGSGSEFRFSVTLGLGVSPPTAVSPDLPPGLSILIIDDHPLARDVLTQMCRGFGWRATALDSGVAGLEELRLSMAQDREYDLLLLDWRMPGMDGIDMLRQAYATPDIGLPLVVLMASTIELEQAAAASDDLYLDGIAAKPMTPSDLLMAVTRAFSGEISVPLPVLGRADQRLFGMRLLVAEDNELNQEVMEQVLIRAGAEVVIAANGLAAVETLRRPGVRFDAVLMDIQMPVMDGYTATRIIREQLGLHDLPIIAVTAFARPQDREKTRLAGMVGHLVKPIDVEDLLDLVARGRIASASQFAERRGSARHTTAPTITLAGLDVVAALDAFGGDQKRYQEMLRKLILRHGGEAAEAMRLFNAEDPDGAIRVLHGLSGVASILQATELARLAAAAERTLLDGNSEAMPRLFDELQAAMHTFVASVDQLEALWADA